MSSVGFIGAGQMAQALATGISESDPKLKFLISDPNQAARELFASRVGIQRVEIAQSNQEVLELCDLVFLAVKPQYLTAALANLSLSRTDTPLIVSVIAGTSSRRISELTGIKRVIRVMPNTPCLIGLGACGMAAAESISEADVARVKSYMESVGEVSIVPEQMLDSVTGLSGSGPAFVFSFIESLVQGAVLTGLPRDTAQLLAVQTVLGAAALVKESGEHTSVLRDRVTSPGGTTIAGLKALEEKHFGDAVMSAVIAATERSRELGKE